MKLNQEFFFIRTQSPFCMKHFYCVWEYTKKKVFFRVIRHVVSQYYPKLLYEKKRIELTQMELNNFFSLYNNTFGKTYLML